MLCACFADLVMGFSDSFKYYNAESSLGIKYLWLITIPSILLFCQVVFNTKLLWVIIFTLIAGSSIYAIAFTTKEIIAGVNDPVKTLRFDFKDVVILFVVLLLYLLINFIVFKLRPIKTETRKV